LTDLYDEIINIKNSGIKAVLCIVTNTKGSAPRKAGAKMIVYYDGRISGSIGGGSLEKKIKEDALNVLKENKAAALKYDLLSQLGMCCGGTVEIFIEPIVNTKRLFIFGAGHTGQALAVFAAETGFEIYLIDDRKEYLDQSVNESVYKMNLHHTAALQSIPFDLNTFIVITTYSHQIDRDILAYCIKRDFAYLGMIGSRRKAEITKKMFIESNLASSAELDKVHMPIGVDINAETPAEIAISIIAEIVKTKNNKTEKVKNNILCEKTQ